MAVILFAAARPLGLCRCGSQRPTGPATWSSSEAIETGTRRRHLNSPARQRTMGSGGSAPFVEWRQRLGYAAEGRQASAGFHDPTSPALCASSASPPARADPVALVRVRIHLDLKCAST